MCRKGQHWLGLWKLLIYSFELINGLEASILSVFICLGIFFSLIKISFPKIDAPHRILGPLAPPSLLSMQGYTTNVVLSCTLLSPIEVRTTVSKLNSWNS